MTSQVGCATEDPRQEEEVKYVRHGHIFSQRESTKNRYEQAEEIQKVHNLGMKKIKHEFTLNKNGGGMEREDMCT